MKVYTQSFVSYKNDQPSVETDGLYVESSLTVIHLDQINKYLVLDGSGKVALYDLTGEKLKEVELYNAEDARPKEILGADESQPESKDN